MKVGKLTPATLASSVFGQLGVRRPDVLVHAGIGEDSAVIDFGDFVAVLSTDPITGATREQGWLGVHVACNDVAAMGAAPLGVMVTLLFPEAASERDVATLMADVHRAALDLGIEVLGGHSEVTPGIAETIISVTAIGRAAKSRFVTSAGARAGDCLVLTKAAGLEGTAILAGERAGDLLTRLPADLIERARGFVREISVVREALAAADAGATAMHDATEGGVLGAVYELALASGLGAEIEVEAVPVRDETRQICDALGIDPLRLVSSGALLIAAPDGARVIAALDAIGVPATRIGRLTSGGFALVTSAGREPFAPPESDELWVGLQVKPS